MFETLKNFHTRSPGDHFKDLLNNYILALKKTTQTTDYVLYIRSTLQVFYD